MNMLAKLATNEAIKEDGDSVGGGNGPLDSGIYLTTVSLAYLGTSKGGAISLNLHLKTEDNRDLRQTLWMTSGTEKGCKNYYETKDGEKKYLPGFVLANSLCLLTVGKEISDLDTEDKVVKLYDYDTKSEQPTKVPVLTDLLGKQIYTAVMRQTVDKNVKNDSGIYVPSGETRDENEIDKFFRERDKMTVAEIKAQATEPTFFATWSEKWSGKTRNKAKGASGTAGAPAAAAGTTPKPTKSLFG